MLVRLTWILLQSLNTVPAKLRAGWLRLHVAHWKNFLSLLCVSDWMLFNTRSLRCGQYLGLTQVSIHTPISTNSFAFSCWEFHVNGIINRVTTFVPIAGSNVTRVMWIDGNSPLCITIQCVFCTNMLYVRAVISIEHIQWAVMWDRLTFVVYTS